MPKNVYGAPYSHTKITQVSAAPAQEAVNAVASAISNVNSRIVSILTQITDNPDSATKQVVLERIDILRDELNILFK